MISIAIKENGGALAIQGLQTLESEAAEIGGGFKSTLARKRGQLRRIPRPVHLNELGNISRHGVVPNAHDATARGIQFHGREQIRERSRLTRQFGASHQRFSRRETFSKTERGSQKPEIGRLVNSHEIF